MKQLVLDASVTMRWVLVDRVPPLSERIRELLSRENWSAIVPALWYWEVANTVVTASRKGGLVGPMEDAWQRAQNWFERVEGDAFSDRAVVEAVAIAKRHRLTVYDASYLELAQRRGLPLATLDEALQAAGRAAGVQVDF